MDRIDRLHVLVIVKRVVILMMITRHQRFGDDMGPMLWRALLELGDLCAEKLELLDLRKLLAALLAVQRPMGFRRSRSYTSPSPGHASMRNWNPGSTLEFA